MCTHELAIHPPTSTHPSTQSTYEPTHPHLGVSIWYDWKAKENSSQNTVSIIFFIKGLSPIKESAKSGVRLNSLTNEPIRGFVSQFTPQEQFCIYNMAAPREMMVAVPQLFQLLASTDDEKGVLQVWCIRSSAGKSVYKMASK